MSASARNVVWSGRPLGMDTVAGGRSCSDVSLVLNTENSVIGSLVFESEIREIVIRTWLSANRRRFYITFLRATCKEVIHTLDLANVIPIYVQNLTRCDDALQFAIVTVCLLMHNEWTNVRTIISHWIIKYRYRVNKKKRYIHKVFF